MGRGEEVGVDRVERMENTVEWMEFEPVKNGNGNCSKFAHKLWANFPIP